MLVRVARLWGKTVEESDKKKKNNPRAPEGTGPMGPRSDAETSSKVSARAKTHFDRPSTRLTD